MSGQKIKLIKTERDIDDLRGGELISIKNLTPEAFCTGIKDGLYIFSFRDGKKIYELFLNRGNMRPSRIGDLQLSRRNTYDSIEYNEQINPQLYRQKNNELLHKELLQT